MTAEKTEALVIRQTDFSESSRVVSLFTRDFGKISAIAKGGRRLKGPFDAALDLLARCDIVFLRKSTASLDILTEAKLLSRFVPRKEDLTSLYAGYYVAELLNTLTEEYDPFPEVYDAAVVTLEQLSQRDQPGPTILRFELSLLRELGHLPDWEKCVLCRSPLSTQSAPMAYWISQGGLLCARCRKEDYAGLVIQPGTWAVLRRLADSADPLAQRLVVTSQQQKELRSLMTALISHITGKRPKLARYLQS